MNKTTRYTNKGYFERYAIECLIELIDKNYSKLTHTADGSNPDWKGNDDFPVGLEVTRVMCGEDGKINRSISEYYGCGLPQNELIKKIKDKNEAQHEIYIINQTVVTPYSYNSDFINEFIETITNTIDKKINKLNKCNYKLFKKNELFLFLDYMFSFNKEQLLRIQRHSFKSDKKTYDTLFMVVQECLYVISKNEIRKIVLSADKSKIIKKNANPYLP